jgi:type I restriction enzyme S subunit
MKWKELLEIRSGKNQKSVIDPNGQYPIYGSGGIIGYATEYLCPPKTTIVGRKGTINSPIFVNESFWNVDTAFGLIPSSKLLPKYLYYFCCHFNFTALDKSTTIPSLAKRDLENIEMNVPSLDEQSRIVSRIDELFSEIDKAVDTLKATKEQLAVYRQAVLVDAFRVVTNSTHLKIGYVCAKIVDCPHSTPKWEKNGKLCLRTTNFKRGYLDLQSPNYVSEETFNDRNRRIIPQPGDVLYSREGSVLGIACTIPSNVYPCLGQRMMLLRSGEKLNNRYLMHYLNSPMVTNHVIATKGGTGSPHINVGDIKEFQIPIPSLEEQSNIVRQIEEQLSSCDNVEKTVDAILTQADAMRQSILKQAFEGKKDVY